MRVAALLTLAWFGWTLYDSDTTGGSEEARFLSAGLRYLEDENYPDALAAFSKAQAINGENLGALRGKAQALMQIGIRQQAESARLAGSGRQKDADQAAAAARRNYAAALAAYNQSILRQESRSGPEQNRILGVAYANRGILRDRMADYPGALADYRAALKLAPEVQEGPGLVTRFLRNQPEPPPNIAQRADYLQQQMAKPASERLLSLPQADLKQRPYRMD